MDTQHPPSESGGGWHTFGRVGNVPVQRPRHAEIDFGFDVTVLHSEANADGWGASTSVYLTQDQYEGNCVFLGLRHLEATIEALIKARDWCRANADENFRGYVADRYASQLPEPEPAADVPMNA